MALISPKGADMPLPLDLKEMLDGHGGEIGGRPHCFKCQMAGPCDVALLVAELREIRIILGATLFHRPPSTDPLVSMARALVTIFASSAKRFTLNTSMPGPPSYTGPPLVTLHGRLQEQPPSFDQGYSQERTWVASFRVS